MGGTFARGPMGEYWLYKNGDQSPYWLLGIMKKPDEVPVSMWNYFFRVEDIDKAADYIKSNGAQILVGPMEIPGDEYSISGLDPQGAIFSLVGKRL